MGSRAGFLLLLSLLALGPGPERKAIAQGPGVDLALVLAIDCSFSVDSREFRLQMDGLARALRDPDVQEALSRGPNGRIAITAMQWADEGNQIVIVPWTILDGPPSANAVAATLEATPRSLLEGGTAIGAALRQALGLFGSLPWQAARKVIDVSSDGRNNVGPQPQLVRELAQARQVTVNGLVIVNEWPNLDSYFRDHVITGDGAFVIVANDYEAYAKAMIEKLLREMTGPGTS